MQSPDTSSEKSKAELRQLARTRRDGIPKSMRLAASRKACEALFSSSLVDNIANIMLYASMGSEMDTAEFVSRARERGLRLAFPRVVRAERYMEAVWIDCPDQLAPGVWGILEPKASLPPAQPAELDLIIVPGLAFDRRGYRIGYGAGYYDRFLPQAERALRVGLTYDCCVFDELPHAAYDERVTWMLTESGLHAVTE